MLKLIGLVFIVCISSINAQSHNNHTINSVESLKLFVHEAIQRGVLPKQIVVKNYFWKAKFEDIDFNFRTYINWDINSKCPAHKDEIIDATKGLNHSIECDSGDTIIVAGNGADWIDDVTGNDIIYAGEGNDTIDAGEASDILIFEKGWGHDKVSLAGFEVDPKTIIGDDGSYRWKYSSFIVFGKGIKPDDLQWNGNVLTHKKTGDSIEFSRGRNFNIVFMDVPVKAVNNRKVTQSIQTSVPIALYKQKVESLAVHKNILYLCNGHLGVDIVDTQDNSHPVHISHVDLPGRALQAKWHNNLLFVAQSDTDMVDKKGWLSIINVADPARPKLLSSLKYGGRVYDLLFYDNKLIIDESDHVDYKTVIHIVDIHNPKKPKEIVSIPFPMHVLSIVIDKNRLWVAALYGQGVYGYDLNDLQAAPGHFTIENKWIYQMQSNEKIAAILVGSSKQVIAFFADPKHFEKGLISSIAKATDMQSNNAFQLKDNYLFVAEGKRGVYIYDLKEIKQPVLIQKIEFDQLYIKNIAISDTAIYAVDAYGGIFTQDIQGMFLKQNLSKDQLLTLLYKAISNNDALEVDRLIDLGAPFDTSGHERNTPLESAAGSGNIEALKVLLKRGADPNSDHGKAIILAALYEKGDALRLLAEYGGNMNVKDKDDECTALHYIAQDGDVKTAKFLISKGADIFATCRGKQVPLNWAKFGKNQAMIEYLNSVQKLKLHK